MNYKQTLKELYSLDSPKFRQTLKNQKALLKKLGNPEKKLKCIHVAGTNGKGSVCAMLSSILANAGYKVGMYTSPHLKRFNERIRINSKLITGQDIAKYYLEVKPYITNQTFFEITTSIAFLYFYNKKVDFAVLEVGLGGRLDSTNVIKPLISIITNVGIEHTDYLGKDIKKIAYEKAGIIKKNIPVITAASGAALETIKKISNKKNSKLIITGQNKIKKYYNRKNNYWSFDINTCKNLKLDNLGGEFQIINAATAVAAIDTIKKNYSIKINKKNIKNGLKKTKWPGRFQFTGKNILMDCAHNPDGFKLLAKELKNISYNKLILVVGFSNDKDIKKISEIIKPKADRVIITKSGSERAAEPKIIKKYFNKNSVMLGNQRYLETMFPVPLKWFPAPTPLVIKNPKNALKHAKKLALKKDLILITGSIFLVGELI